MYTEDLNKGAVFRRPLTKGFKKNLPFLREIGKEVANEIFYVIILMEIMNYFVA